jgi:hypothetical protein
MVSLESEKVSFFHLVTRRARLICLNLAKAKSLARAAFRPSLPNMPKPTLAS